MAATPALAAPAPEARAAAPAVDRTADDVVDVEAPAATSWKAPLWSKATK
jgi:hypothetical protein